MKKIVELIFSSKATLILLIIFTIAIGYATFIEEKYDTITAKLLIYNAKWFEFILLLLVLNFIGSIKKYHLLRKGKFAGFLFHFAFIVVLIGAGITRYIGYEGMMHIYQGESSNSIYSADPYLTVTAIEGTENYSYHHPVLIGAAAKNSFDTKIVTKNNGTIDIRFKDYKVNAVESPEKGGAKGQDFLIMEVDFNGKTLEVPLKRNKSGAGDFQKVEVDGIDLQMAYGQNRIELPFSIRLNKFILERYAGSNSPSSYASEVTVIDERKGTSKDHRIYMNNVLDYGGYRFFQSSYDSDEKGTILSVNHDFYGTWISYFGYFLLALGFILTLFSPNSRYRDLIRRIKHTRVERKTIISILIFSLTSVGSGFSQDNPDRVDSGPRQNPVSVEHAEKFGHLIVQNYDGRFSPLNTLAYDVMHKISRKDNFNIPGIGKMKAMQVFMDLPMNASFWKDQRIIYVKEKPIMELLGAKGKYATFNDFFDEQGGYKLGVAAEAAFRKKPAEQNPLDKEIIKVNERIDIFIRAFQGKLFKIFPAQGASNNKWIDLGDPLSKVPLTGEVQKLNEDWQLQELNYYNIMKMYLTEVYDAINSGDYSRADKILGDIDSIQRLSDTSGLLPSPAKVKREINYNDSKIFINLKNIYALLSVVLLILSFIDNLRVKKSKILSIFLNGSIVLLGLAFAYHTYGMGLRWYLSGHAPWSNGYEALILIAWGALLAGFSFARFSKITLAATALLAFFTLMTASHSSYDPQLTNLQPVLKSYWLIIHVATLTISYGFLGLAFVLGLMNLGLFSIKNTSNYRRIDLMIKELTHINEINITVGLVLATVGTFLGGIWANESWGRYWGWDAKETWALVIVLSYAIILHFRLVPKMKSLFVFNVGSVICFGTVLMTFFGVNYYLSKGLHSYASGESPIFPMWAWITIIGIITLIVFAGLRDNYINKRIHL